MRELSIEETNEVSGGWIFVVPPAVKVGGAILGAIGTAVGIYQGGQALGGAIGSSMSGGDSSGKDDDS